VKTGCDYPGPPERLYAVLRDKRGGSEKREHSLKRETEAVLISANLTLVLSIEVVETAAQIGYMTNYLTDL
jgi:hypothetical protein